MRQFSPELKDQILKEVKETGIVSVVAKKHNIPPSTVYTWISRLKKPTTKSLENHTSKKKIKDLEKQLSEKELENRVLKDLLKKTNHAWLGE